MVPGWSGALDARQGRAEILGTWQPAVPTVTVSGRGARDLSAGGGEDTRPVLPALAGSIYINEPEMNLNFALRLVAVRWQKRRDPVEPPPGTCASR